MSIKYSQLTLAENFSECQDSLNKLKGFHSTNLTRWQEGISKLYLLNFDVIKDLTTTLYSGTWQLSNLQTQTF